MLGKEQQISLILNACVCLSACSSNPTQKSAIILLPLGWMTNETFPVLFFVSASSDTSTVAQSVRVSWTSESRLDDDAGEFAVVGDSSFFLFVFLAASHETHSPPVWISPPHQTWWSIAILFCVACETDKKLFRVRHSFISKKDKYFEREKR